MIDFLKHFITKNPLLKAISLVMALLLWVIVVNKEDPETTTTVANVPISILNEDYFLQRDQYVTIDSAMKVNVTISGQRSVIENIETEDLTATIDYLSVIASEGKALVSVTANDRRISVERQSISYVKLNVQDMVSRTFDIELHTEGTPKEGFQVVEESSEAVMEPSVVTVKGPADVLDTLDYARVIMNVDGAEETLSGKGKTIIFYGKDGSEVDVDALQEVTFSARMMSQLILPVYAKQSVPLELPTVSLEESSEYYIDSITAQPSEVTLCGSEKLMASLSSLKLSSKKVDDTVMSWSFSYSLNDLLEEAKGDSGETLVAAEGQADNIVVQIELQPKSVQTLTMKNANIVLVGENEGMTYHYVMQPIQIQVMGAPEDMEGISASDIVISLDVHDLTESGTYDVAYTVVTPERIVQKGETTGTISVEVTMDDSEE